VDRDVPCRFDSDQCFVTREDSMRNTSHMTLACDDAGCVEFPTGSPDDVSPALDGITEHNSLKPDSGPADNAPAISTLTRRRTTVRRVR
jgi:hypothetical protein